MNESLMIIRSFEGFTYREFIPEVQESSQVDVQLYSFVVRSDKPSRTRKENIC